MKKHGLWVVVSLVLTGIIVGTLGTWSAPLGYGISGFWPAFVVQAAGGAWFGGWGVLAAMLFPIFTNALANVGLSGILGFIPANLAQGLIPAWAFRHFHADPAIPGRKGLIFYAIWGALIPAAAGGLIGSLAVILFGQAHWNEYLPIAVKWAVPDMVVSFLIGVPIMRELTPLWRNLGMLVKDWWNFEQAGSWAFSRHFQDMPIQLKLVLAMCGAGLGPLLILSLLELVRNGGNSVTESITPLFLTISLVALVLAVGFLSRETVRPLQELKEQVEALVQYRNGELTVERTDEIGQLGQAFVFLIEDWRRADASLKASEEKYRTLIENLNVGVFQSTLNGRFLHANSAVIHMAGYDNWDEFEKMPISSLYVDPADRERLVDELRTQGHVRNVEMRSIKKDGTLYWIALNAVLFKDSEEKPEFILGSVMDITERKQQESQILADQAELQRLLDESDQSRRTLLNILEDQKAAKDEIHKLNADLEKRVAERTAQLETANNELEAFSYSVSHDLRAPLRAIDGFSQILQDDYIGQLPQSGAEMFSKVRASVARMNQLIDDLLRFSRFGRQPLNIQNIQPLNFVHQALEILKNEQAGRQVEIVIGDLPCCQADPSLLMQVWVNLLSNALKYSRKCAIARIEVGCLAGENNEPVYYVRDNGTGFDMEYADKLFGVFQRLHTESEFEGTGVGLALVQRIIVRHGGRIWADAALGEGATFYFTMGSKCIEK
jgi:PAS domain S-box-containing protein